MDVSIIIPSYNRLWALPAAIESCRHTKCTTEIIVIDDGSTDDTWAWLQQQKDIIIIKQQNWGKCWAVNNGFAIANGKYIKFLDSDDRLVAGALDEQFEIAEANTSDIVVSGYHLVDDQQNILRKQLWVNCDDFIAQQLGECDSSHYSAYLFKRSFIEDIPHRPDYAYRDDRLFVLEAALKLPLVAVHPGFALLHTEHKMPRLQKNNGFQRVTQNFQHLNIYKKILTQLQDNDQLSQRRIKAAINILWPLCCWIARDNINEAANLLKWIMQLDPYFEPRGQGLIGFMYKTLSVKNTNSILRLKWFFNRT